jgi:hypothetical protein
MRFEISYILIKTTNRDSFNEKLSFNYVIKYDIAFH